MDIATPGASELVGPFELRILLGRGGGGEAWAGVHLPTGTEVVLKRPMSTAHQAATRLDREIMMSSRLVHPHVVRVLDARRLTAEHDPFLVLARAQHGALVQHELAGDPAALTQALLDALAGLGHLHACGVLHLDVKPSNLFVNDGHVWVGDLGAATPRWTDDLSPPQPLAGTTGYMAPEHRAGDRSSLGPWTDLWSLGATARQLAHGSPPGWLDAWCQGCMAPAPHARFRSAAHAARALRALAPPPSREALLRHTRGASRHSAAPAMGSQETHTTPFVEAIFPRDEPAARGEPPTAPTQAHEGSVGVADVSGGEPNELPPGLGAGAMGARRPPLVGREAQCAALAEAWARAAAGGLVILQLEGPSGVGTTRLAEWQAERAQERDGALSLEVRLGAGGLAGGLRRWALGAGREEGDARVHVSRRLDAEGIELRDDLQGDLSALLDQQQVPGARLALVFERLVGALRRRGPVVLVLDGVDETTEPLAWLDGALAQLVRQGPHGVLALITRAPPTPDGALRPPRFEPGPGAETLAVPPLERIDVERLASRLLGFDGPASQQVAAHSAGLPGHLVEHVMAWVQSGALVSGPRGLALAPGAAPPVPLTLASRARRQIEAALGPLDAVRQRAVAVSALLGGDPGDGALARALAACGLPEVPVEALRTSGLALVSGAGWRWTLPGVEDALIDGEPPHRQLRAACARALDRGGKLGGEVCARIARLHAQAGDPLASLDAMARVISVDLSPDVARSLAELLARIEAQLPAPAEQALGAGLLARMHYERGNHGEARSEALRCRQLAALVSDDAGSLALAQFQALHTLALVQAVEGRPGEEAISLAREAITWAERVGPDDLLAARLLEGRLLIISGRSWEAIPRLESALAACDGACDGTRWRGWVLLADACASAGQPELALAPCQQAIDAMQAAGGHWLLGQAYNMMADALMRQRRFAEAIPVLRLALRELYPRTPTAGYVRANLAFCHLQLTEFALAASYLDEALGYLTTDARHRLWCLLQSLRLPLLARSSVDELDACCEALEHTIGSQRLVFTEPPEAATLAAETLAQTHPPRAARLVALARSLATHVEDPALLARLRPRWGLAG